MVALALKRIGEAGRFLLTRHWVRTRIGPYVVTTTEVRPSAYETWVSWGEEGPEVEHFATGLALQRASANTNHEATCKQVAASLGPAGVPTGPPPAA